MCVEKFALERRLAERQQYKNRNLSLNVPDTEDRNQFSTVPLDELFQNGRRCNILVYEGLVGQRKHIDSKGINASSAMIARGLGHFTCSGIAASKFDGHSICLI